MSQIASAHPRAANHRNPAFVSFGFSVFGDADCDDQRGVGGEGFGGCCSMMKGPRGDRPTPRSATRSQSPQKLILHHFSPKSYHFGGGAQLTGKKDGQVDQKSQKTFFLQIEPLSV